MCNLTNEENKLQARKVLELAIGPEKVLIFGQCGPKKLIWPAR